MSSLKKLIMMANQGSDSSSLPSHLERAEYLEATGTQYMDLGYPLGYNNKVVVDVHPVNKSNWLYVFGSTPVTGKRFDLSINTSKYFNGTGNSPNIYHDYKYSIVFNKEGIISDGTFYGWTATPKDFTTEDNVFLFSTRDASGAAKYFYQGKIYACQIYEHDTLIHDYIPAFNTENRRPCLYDTITGIELYNQGTGEFNYHIEGKAIPYLAFEALEDDLQVSITKSATQYSLDRVNWVDLPAEEMTPPISKGERVWFRAEITPDGTSTGIGTFSCTKQCNLEGTPMSLLYGDRAGDFLSLPNKGHCFAYLFAYNDKIIRVNNPMEFLPAMHFPSTYCYHYMFAYCTNLKNGCYLPCLMLTNLCYARMYTNCMSLTETFDFPKWNSIGQNVCAYMFNRCVSLIRQPRITSNADMPSSDSYASMFRDCIELEDIQDTLPSLVVSASSYSYMYKGCVRIKKAPEILAVTNKTQSGVCPYMFAECYNLEEAPSKILIEPFGAEHMFENCFKLKKSPILCYQGQLQYGYRYMFNGCSSLDYIVCLEIDALNSITQSNYLWVSGVAPKGTIVLNKNIEWNPEDYRGVNGIPVGWEVKYCDPDNLDDVRDYREIDKAWNE